MTRYPVQQLALLVGAVLYAACSGTADSSPGESTATTSEAITASGPDFVNVSATYVGGAAIAVGVGPADPWVVGTNSQPYHYTGFTTRRAWSPVTIATVGTRIAASPEGTPWLVDFGNHLWRYNGTQWILLPSPAPSMYLGGCLTDLGVGAGNTAWAVGCDDNGTTGASVYYWTESAQSWTQWPGRAKRIAVSPEGNPWIVDDAHNVLRHSASGFSSVSSGNATAIGVGANDVAWIIGVPGAGASNAAPYSLSGGSFVQMSSVLGKEISVGADGTPWMVASNNTIYRWDGTWTSLGPRGFALADQPTVHYAGDVQDIDVSDIANNRLVVGTSGGGVWVLNTSTNVWSSIGDTAFGAGPSGGTPTIAQKPGDPNKTLVVATGVTNPNDASAGRGNGIWQGSLVNGSWQWTAKVCEDVYGLQEACPSSFTKIRYNPANSNVIFASSAAANPAGGQYGFYVSTNGGPFVATRLASLTDNVTDFAVDPNGQRLYILGRNAGVEVSTDGGHSISTTILPAPLTMTNQFWYAKIALAPTDPTIAYMTVANSSDNFEGALEGTNMRTAPTWASTAMASCVTTDGCSSTDDHFLQTQFNHDQAIAVSPAASGTFIVSGTKAWRSVNGGGPPGSCFCPSGGPTIPPGTNWSLINGVHDDIHAIAYVSASQIYISTDGGIYSSIDSGATWTGTINTIPVQQEYSVSVYNDTIIADAWDVGTHYSGDHGSTWSSNGAVSGTDFNGANVALDGGPITMFTTCFSCGGQVYQSLNGGSSWSATALSVQENPTNKIGIVEYAGGSWYTTGSSSWNGVEFATEFSTWQTYGAQLPSQPTWVTVGDTPDACSYVIAAGFPNSKSSPPNVQISTNSCGSVVQGPWSEVGASLPRDIVQVVRDEFVTGTPTDTEIYVLTGLTGSGRVFANKLSTLATTPGGGTWKELTGNLGLVSGAVQFNTVLGDPTGYNVFVGTSVGVFKTTNDCVRSSTSCVWQPWGNGMPQSPASVPFVSGGTSAANGDPGTAVTKLTAQHHGSGTYVYAATWERGIWTREITADDP
jgi:hypothetical protein